MRSLAALDRGDEAGLVFAGAAIECRVTHYHFVELLLLRDLGVAMLEPGISCPASAASLPPPREGPSSSGSPAS